MVLEELHLIFLKFVIKELKNVSNKMQYVIHNDIRSSLNKIQFGVPLNISVLGPILFVLYINDLSNISPIFKPILFADDTTFICNDNIYKS